MTALGDFINGKFVKVDQPDGQFTDLSPADLNDQVMLVEYTYQHVDLAVEAARKAYLPWARLSMEDRKNHLQRLKSVFDTEKENLAIAISRDTGKPKWESLTEAAALSAKIDVTLQHSIRWVEEERIPNALPQIEGVIRFKPRGVMAVIGPFNFPAHLPNGHIIPSLLMGNTVVFKPSEQTPFVAQVMAQCFEKADLPKGVFNLVQGDGETGRKLVLHESVDGILFTGSYEVGLKIKQETMNHYWKILALEMGGKNTTLVWDDASMEKALYESLVGAFMTTGQRCSCSSRIIVHKKIAEEFTQKFYESAKRISIGHWSENPFMGPLINQAAVEKYLRFQEIGVREGNESYMRGKVLELKHKGHYVTPSIHLVKNFDQKSVFQKTEIFGPNVALMTTDDFDEALSWVNATGFGLAMALFTKNESLYRRALLEARVGLLNWNRTTNGASSKLPFGGLGKSGNDRPSGDFAIQYCSVPVASLEDHGAFDASKNLPGLVFPTTN